MAVSEAEQKLLDAIKELGEVPQADTPAELQEWMMSHLRKTGRIPQESEELKETRLLKQEPITGASASAGTKQTLRINTFSGDPDAKGDTTFDLWSFEVQCLINDGVYPEEIIRQAARKSLKGNAGRVVMRLGPEADLKRILDKLEVVYGVVDVGESLLSEFYAAKQGKKEDVAAWGCRIEDLLDKAKQQTLLDRRDADNMLRERFWTGLRPELKQTSRHKYDTISDFDQLQIELRKIEKEFQVAEGDCKEGIAKMATPAAQEKGPTEVTELKGMVHRLTNEMHTMKLQLHQEDSYPGNTGMAYGQNFQGQSPGMGARPQYRPRYGQPQQPRFTGSQRQPTFSQMPPPQDSRLPMSWQGRMPHQQGNPTPPRMQFGQQQPNQQWNGNCQQAQEPQWQGGNYQQQQAQGAPQTQERGCWRCGGTDH